MHQASGCGRRFWPGRRARAMPQRVHCGGSLQTLGIRTRWKSRCRSESVAPSRKTEAGDRSSRIERHECTPFTFAPEPFAVFFFCLPIMLQLDALEFSLTAGCTHKHTRTETHMVDKSLSTRAYTIPRHIHSVPYRLCEHSGVLVGCFGNVPLASVAPHWHA